MKVTETYAFSYLTKQLPQPTAFINTSFEIVCTSDTWLEYFGFSPNETQGKVIFDLFPQGHHGHWKACLKNCLNGEKEFGIQCTPSPAGKEHWFEWTNLPWYDEEENIVGAIIQVVDITKRLENELKYEKLENLLRHRYNRTHKRSNTVKY